MVVKENLNRKKIPKSQKKQLFILLLGFSGPLACNRTKCLFLNDEVCMIKPTLINLNPVELKYCLFMISLDKCTGSFKILSPKICVPKETKDINVKTFNMIQVKMKLKK